MNRKTTFLVVILMVLSAACSKPYPKKITYLATASVSAYNLQYLNKQNELAKTEVVPQSVQDVWTYEFTAEEGDIVYINGKYGDINSGLKIQVLIDGKVYKQESTVGDTINYIVVSGVVPYE